MKAAESGSFVSYQLEQIYPIEQSYRLRSSATPADDERMDVSIYWNWYVAGERRVAVTLGIQCVVGMEHSEEARAAAVAVFSIQKEEPDVPLQLFLQRDGPATLVPYLHEILTSLTARSLTGAVDILPFDLNYIPKHYPFEESAGVRFLSANKGAAERLGIPLSLPKKRRTAKKRSSPDDPG